MQVKAGDTVLEVYADSNSFTERRVAKVYANGNFILEGSKRQWRPSSYSDYARETGQSHWSRRYMYQDTPERRTRYAQAQAQSARENRFARTIEKLREYRRGMTEDEVLAAERLLASLEGRWMES